jgi:hypothetical protein
VVAGGLAGQAVRAPERLVVDGMTLHDGAHGGALGELVPRRRQRRLVVDPAGEGRRDGDDDVARTAVAGVRRHRDPDGVLGDAPHGGAQHHVEPVRQQDREPLRPADEAVLLRATAGAEQDVPTVAGVQVEQRVQQGQLGRLRRPDGGHAGAQQLPGGRRGDVAPQPGLERLAVPRCRVERAPRGVQRHRPGHPVGARLRLRDVGQHQRVEARHRPGVPAHASPTLEDLVAGVVGGERGDAELAGQRQDGALLRTGPLAAYLHHLAVSEVGVQRAAAHPPARLEHAHRQPG